MLSTATKFAQSSDARRESVGVQKNGGPGPPFFRTRLLLLIFFDQNIGTINIEYVPTDASDI